MKKVVVKQFGRTVYIDPSFCICYFGPGEEGEAVALRMQDTTAEDDETLRLSSFRTSFPQVVVTLVQSLLLLALGMMIGVPTIVIAALLDSPAQLSMSNTQASWFAGILLAVQPFGSILSGALSEAVGRKKCMMLVGVPQLAGWVLMYFSYNLPLLYLSSILLGFSIGFMEAPGLSYVGEISQPHLRARLCSLSSMAIPVGYLVMYLMGTVLEWRSVAAFSSVLPVLTFLALTKVPESPMWLVKKGRLADAEASLCWLRGWVTVSEIKKEFNALQAYCNKAQLEHDNYSNTRSSENGQIYIEVPRNGNGPESGRPRNVSSSVCEKLKGLTKPDMIRPLRLVVCFFFFYHCGGITGLRPYMVKVFHQLELTIDPYWLSVASAALQITGAIFCLMTIHRLGKRRIAMISMTGCAWSVVLLGVYALLTTHHGVHLPYIPMILFALLFFFTNVGISPVPWALISEVFPPRGRGVGGGMSSALYYIMYFLSSKTFLDLESLLGLHGVFFFYGSLGLLGILFIFYCVPETEGHNLEEIQDFFKDKTDKKTPQRC